MLRPVPDVLEVLAEPSRRRILDALREGELPVGTLVDRLGISQPLVSKHLRVLREARLVWARERGREWHYSLDARPLAEVYRDWLESFAPYWEESLGRLKRRVEEGDS